MNSQAALLNLAKRVQAIAENGLHYAESDWDQDRYKDLEQVALQMLSILSRQPLELVQSITPENNGYRTPKIDVRAVIFNEKHEILMVKERVDGRWSMPGGWCDVGLTPVEVVEKEAREEAGIEAKATRLVAVMDKKCHDHPVDLFSIYKLFIECEAASYDISVGMETLDVGFFPQDKLPELSTPRNTKAQIDTMYDFHYGRLHWPIID